MVSAIINFIFCAHARTPRSRHSHTGRETNKTITQNLHLILQILMVKRCVKIKYSNDIVVWKRGDFGRGRQRETPPPKTTDGRGEERYWYQTNKTNGMQINYLLILTHKLSVLCWESMMPRQRLLSWVTAAQKRHEHSGAGGDSKAEEVQKDEQQKMPKNATQMNTNLSLNANPGLLLWGQSVVPLLSGEDNKIRLLGMSQLHQSGRNHTLHLGPKEMRSAMRWTVNRRPLLPWIHSMLPHAAPTYSNEEVMWSKECGDNIFNAKRCTFSSSLSLILSAAFQVSRTSGIQLHS